MALLIARDTPTQAAELYDVQPNGPNGAIVCALGVDGEGTPHFLQYFFQRGDDGWLLQTSGPTVNEAHYVQELTGQAPATVPLAQRFSAVTALRSRPAVSQGLTCIFRSLKSFISDPAKISVQTE